MFPSRVPPSVNIGTRQYACLVGDWVEEIGLSRAAYGTDNFRRPKVALIHMRTGNLRAVQILLGHAEPRARPDTSASTWKTLALSEAAEV